MQQNIKKEEIKANLYDEINIIVDYTGLTDGDVLEKSLKLDTLIKDGKFEKSFAPLTFEEIEEYAVRQKRELSLAAKRNSIEEDNSIRYIRNDNLVEIVIYRNFSQIRIYYGENIKHSLREYFGMLDSIAECLGKDRDFFKIQTVYVQKKNEIFARSLYQIFRCFDRSLFGTFIQGSSKDGYVLNIVQNKENFFSRDLEFDVLKAVNNGMDNNTQKEVFRGQLYITGRYDTAPIDDISVKDILNRINDGIFDVFKRYLTAGFLEDMKEGKTSKLIGGFHL